jgi:Holliday junction DNA helicase RuvA
MEPRDLFAAVQRAVVVRLTGIPGIGKKTAERIVVELRDRAADFTGGAASLVGKNVPHDPVAEAGIALQQLGYKPAEIARMLKEGAPGDSAEDIIRKALKSMLRNG